MLAPHYQPSTLSPLARWVACSALVSLLGACSPGTGEGLDTNGRPLDEGGDGGPLTAEFGSIQANVFTPSCATAGCHAGAAAPQGLRLDEGSSYALLVGIASSQDAATLRVEPFNPDASYLIQKMEGTAAVGGRMPLNGPPYLAQATVDVVRQWIADGAAPPVVSVPTPPQVVSIDPVDGASIDQLPATVSVVFSHEMDASLVSSATFLVSRSGGDGTFGDGNEIDLQPVDVRLDASNARIGIIDLSGVATADDTYQIRLIGSGATSLASVDGEILDGDADGQAGGDFVSSFIIASAQANLQSIQDSIFTPSCSSAGCHSGPAGPGLPGGQDLSTVAGSFASLVNVPSVQEPGLLRVSPGGADASYLIHKLEGTATSGSQMPLGAAPLSQDSIDAIRSWIDAGADSGSADVNPPTVTLQNIAADVAGDLLLTATAQDDVGIAQVTFLVDGVAVGSAVTEPYEIIWDSTSVADGSHEASAEVYDLSGNVGISATQTFSTSNGIDTTPPEVALTTIASPLAGTVTLSATASDNIGVTQIEFTANGTVIGTVTASPYEIQWNTMSVANADYEIVATASDAAGNSTTSAAQTVTVSNDLQSPTVSITSPADGDDVSGQVLVTITASDDVAIADVTLLVNGVASASDADVPYEFLWDTTALTDDSYDLTARATDTSGKSTDSEVVRADVDNSGCTDITPPTVSLTAPAAGNVSGTVAISATASDDVGVTLVSFFAAGQLLGTDATTPYEFSWDTTASANGNVNLTANATDGCNTTVSAAVTVTVDNAATLLSVASLSPAADATEVDFPATITATFSGTVNAATVTAASFVVERSGGDGSFGDGNEVQLLETVSASADQADMNLANVFPAFDDTYRVTLSDTITDTAGNLLDGDNDGTAGGDYVATFQTALTTYVTDAQPIFQRLCDTCHTGDGNGGHDIGTVYSDGLQAADDDACTGLTVGECTIVLIQTGVMPLGAGCSGDPAQDTGNASCLTQAEQDTIQDWINDRLPE